MTTKNINDLLFKVEKVEVTEYPTISDFGYQIFGYPNGVKTLLNCCSERYRLIPNVDIIPNVLQVLDKTGLKYSVSYRMIDYSVFYVDIIISDDRYYIGTKQDKLQMKISIAHSYNNSEKYHISMGTFHRVKCTNGLWMTKYDTEKYGLNIIGKHTEKINESLHMFENKLNFVLTNDVFQKCLESFQPLFDNWVEKWTDRVEEVMKVAAIGTTANNVNHVASQIRKEASELYNGKVNDWLIYNGVNHLLFDDNSNVALDAARKVKDSKVLEYLLYK
jgi:hypothetical protein